MQFISDKFLNNLSYLIIFITMAQSVSPQQRFISLAMEYKIPICLELAKELIQIVNKTGKDSQETKLFVQEQFVPKHHQKLLSLIESIAPIQIQTDVQHSNESQDQNKRETEQSEDIYDIAQNGEKKIKVQQPKKQKQLLPFYQYFKIDKRTSQNKNEKSQIVLIIISQKDIVSFQLSYKFDQAAKSKKFKISCKSQKTTKSDQNQYYHLVRFQIQSSKSVLYLEIKGIKQNLYNQMASQVDNEDPQHDLSGLNRVQINANFGFKIIKDQKIKILDSLKIVNSWILFITQNKHIFPNLKNKTTFFNGKNEKQVKEETKELYWLIQLSKEFSGKTIEQDILRKTISFEVNYHYKLRYIMYLLVPLCKKPQIIIQRIKNNKQFISLFEKKYTPQSQITQQLKQLYLRAINRYFMDHHQLWANESRQQSQNENKKIVIQNLLQCLKITQEDSLRIQLLKISLKVYPKFMFNFDFRSIIKQKRLLSPMQYFSKCIQVVQIVDLDDHQEKSKNMNKKDTDNLFSIKRLLQQYRDMSIIWISKNPPQQSFPHSLIIQQQFKKISKILRAQYSNSKTLPSYLNFWKKMEQVLLQIEQINEQFVQQWKKKIEYNQSIKIILKHHSQMILEILLKIINKEYKKKLRQKLIKQGRLMPQNLQNITKSTEMKDILKKAQNEDIQKEFNQIVQILVLRCAEQYDAYKLASLAENNNDHVISKLIGNLLQKQDIKFILKASQKNNTDRQHYINLGIKCFKFKQTSHIYQKLCLKYCKFIQVSKFKKNEIAIELVNKMNSQKLKNIEGMVKIISQNLQGNYNIEQITQKVFQDPKVLESYKNIFSQKFSQIQKILAQKIDKSDITYEQLKRLDQNKKQIKDLSKMIYKSFISLQEKIQQFKNKLNSILNLLQQIKFKQRAVIAQFEKLSDSFKQKRLNQGTKIQSQQRQKLFDLSLEIKVFINIQKQKWSQSVINNVYDIFEKTQTFKAYYRLFFERYKTKKINYAQFKLKFPKKARDQLLKYCQNQQIRTKVLQTAKITDIQNLQEILKIAKGFNFILKTTQKQVLNAQPLINLVKMIEQKKQINLFELQTVVLKTMQDFKGQQLKAQSKNYQTLYKILLKTGQYEKVFKFIQQSNIEKATIEELKQHLNDLEYSTLRFEEVKQLQETVCYWNLIKKSKGTSGKFINYLSQEIQTTNRIFWKSIQNTFHNEQFIKQKIDQSQNRQTSFKYEIEKICQNSTLQIKEYFRQVVVTVTFQKAIKKSQQKNGKVEKNIISITIKDIANLREKCHLLINQFEREKSKEDKKVDQSLRIYKQYCKYSQIIVSVDTNCQSLKKYGFNFDNLLSKITIKGSDYTELINFAKKIQGFVDTWKIKVQTIYQQSYLMTHFIGSELNNFISKISQESYYSPLSRIISMDQKEFQKMIRSQQAKKLLAPSFSNQDFIKSLQNIDKLFESYKQIGTDKRQKQIKFIVSKESEYYLHFFSEKKKPQINEILFCQRDTQALQIQVFLKRCRLSPLRTFYVLSIHNLSIEVQLIFCQKLSRYFSIGAQGNYGKLVFINYSQTEKIYSHLCQSGIFNMKRFLGLDQDELKNNKIMLLRCITNTFLIESKKPGLGKTFHAQNLAKKENRTLKYFPVYGNVNFDSILKRIKELRLKENDSLLIQIGHVQGKQKLQIFLFQLIMFRAFYHHQYIFLPQEIQIIIEIENIFDDGVQQQLPILKLIKSKCQSYIKIQKFQLQKLKFSPEKQDEIFVLNYLAKIQGQKVSNYQFKYQISPKYPPNPEFLVKKYYVQKLQENGSEPSFATYRRFINILATLFKTFAQNLVLTQAILDGLKKQISLKSKKSQKNQIKLQILHIFITNAIDYLKETITSNLFDHKLNKCYFGQKIDKKLQIIPSYKQDTYAFVCLDSKQVPKPIKQFLLSQGSSLNMFVKGQQQRFIYQNLFIISGNRKFNIKQNPKLKMSEKIPALKNYSLTLDNFLKMCYIVQRAQSRIPIIIMGQSGVGKTSLIQFLVESVLQQTLLIFNVHAGFDEDLFIKSVDQIKRKSQSIKKQIIQQNRKKRVWIFFDEFNTTEYLSYIKEMMIDRRFMGQPLPDNLIFISACNPYRKKKSVIVEIKKKSNQQNNLAFKVKPPPLSMIQFMWDYQQLRKQQNKNYISKILEPLKLKKHDELVDAISQSHEYIKKRLQISSVSLRDVSRFKDVYLWLLKYLPTQPARSENKNHNLRKRQEQDLFQIKKQQRAIIISFTVCYSLRFANKKERQQFLKIIQQKLGYDIGQFNRILKYQQIDFINRLNKFDTKIALNFALRQNIFTTFVCIMNKIPILIIGNPGSSKSLAIKIIFSNFRGINSPAQYCRKFPQLNMFYYQGSESCTSQGIQALYQRALQSQKNIEEKNNPERIQNCIFFDQIGLAEKSIHNPLKVLHSKLQTNKKQIGFVGISNWELDAAKMSRFLVLVRSSPDLDELESTAIEIYGSYFNGDISPKEEEFPRKIAKKYQQFCEKWKKENPNKQNFFGLRDFYCLIKNACEELKKKEQINQVDKQQCIIKSFQTNFDGQSTSLKLLNNIINPKSEIKPLTFQTILRQNIQRKQSRYLLIIVKDNSLIPLINQYASKLNQNRQFLCIYGSQFLEDISSEQYNLQVTSKVISHIYKGSILAFKDINNSIQTSLYDLFNKSFYQIGQKKYCRISVGANSNPKCRVHQNFNTIVYLNEKNLKNIDQAFLNRFQKHHVDLSMQLHQIKIAKQIDEWITRIIALKTKDLLKRETFFINSCFQSIISLALKHKSAENPILQMKRDILKNRTTDFDIVLKEGKIQQQGKDQIQRLLQSEVTFQEYKQDKILFTYDPLIEIQQNNRICNESTEKLLISQIKCQNSLRIAVQTFFDEKYKDTLSISVNYNSQSKHVDFLLQLCKEIKKEKKSKKRILVIVQLHRQSYLNKKSDDIVISYLHQYQQFFCDCMTSYYIGKDLLKTTNFIPIFKEITSKKIEIFMVQSLKSFKLNYEHNNDNKVEIQCLQVCKSLTINKNFQKACLQFVCRYMDSQTIFFSQILGNKQENQICSTTTQAMVRLLEAKSQYCIYNFWKIAIEKNLIYHISLQDIKKRLILDPNASKFIQKHITSFEKIITKSFDILKESCINKINKEQIFRKGIQSNRIKIIYPTILPLAYKDFDLFFHSKKNKDKQCLEKYVSSIIDISSANYSQYQHLLQKCQQFFNKASSLKFVTQNSIYSFIYLKDLFQNIGELANTNISNNFKFCCLILEIFKNRKFEEILILIVMDRLVWINFIKIYNLLLQGSSQQCLNEHLLQNLQKFYSETQNNVNDNNLITKYFLAFVKSMFLSYTQLLDFKNFKAKSSQIYLSVREQMKALLQKILNRYGKYGLSIDKNYYKIDKLIRVLSKIDKNQLLQHLKNFSEGYSNKQSQTSLNLKILKYFQNFLQKKKLISQKQNCIIQFLCFDIFPQILSENLIDETTDSCLKSVIKFSNQFIYFANSSNKFFKILFKKFLQADSLQSKYTLISDFQQNTLKILKQSVDFESNFTVSLGNFIRKHILEFINRQIKKKQTNDGLQTQDARSKIFRYYFQYFQSVINRNRVIKEDTTAIFDIEFAKSYLAFYYQYLKNGTMNEEMEKIDTILCQNSYLSNHLKLYALKLMILDEETLQNVRNRYLNGIEIANWITQSKQFLKDYQIKQSFIPPHILDNGSKIFQVIKKFKDSIYLDQSYFEQIINLSTHGAQQKYQCLTFMTTDDYIRKQPQKFKIMLEKIKKTQKNKLLLQILTFYMDHHIPSNKQQDSFMKKDFHILNCINLAISLSGFLKSPLMQMFFKQQDIIHNNYGQFLKNIFIIAGKDDKYIIGLQELLKTLNLERYGCCSQCQCFRGIQKMPFFKALIWSSSCPKCNDTIRYLRSIRQLNPQIKRRKQYLIGYNFGKNQEQIKQNFKQKKLSEKILMFFIFSVWYGLYSINKIDIQFIANSNNKLLWNICQKLLEQLCKEIPYVQEKEVWLFGIMKVIFLSCKGYRVPDQFRQQQKSFEYRNFYQKEIDITINQHLGKQNSQKLVQQNRQTKSGVISTNTSLLKQQTKWNVHKQRFPILRMFKINKELKTDKFFQKLVQDYGPNIADQYPLLDAVFKNESKIIKLAQFQKIYNFVTKLLAKYNDVRISRAYASNTRFQTLFKDHFNNDANIKQEHRQLVTLWNKLAHEGYRLNESQVLRKINIQYQTLKTFLPEKRKNTMLSLLIKTAQDYNQVCSQLEAAFKKINEGQILFDQIVLNPTRMANNFKLLSFPNIKDIVQDFSGFSVQYGRKAPHYAFSQIQSAVANQLKGSQLLQVNFNKYTTIHYLEQMRGYFNQIRTNPFYNQIQLDETQLKKLKNQIKKKYTSNYDLFYKSMKQMQDSIKTILFYYKNINPTKMKIVDFVQMEHIKSISRQFQQQPFKSLDTDVLISLYEVVEESTFQFIPEFIHSAYSEEKLTTDEQQQIKQLIEKLKTQLPDDWPKFKDFKVALYRLVSRCLLVDQDDPKLMLSDFLMLNGQLWPKQLIFERYQESQFYSYLNISLQKCKHLLSYVKPAALVS